MRALFGLVIVLAILYFTGVGGALASRLSQLDTGCYALLTGSAVGGVADPVCGTVARAKAWTITTTQGIAAQIEAVRTRFWGSPIMASLGQLSNELQRGVGGLSSSRERLESMIRQGPSALTGGSMAQQFQQAVDSFAIGRGYLGGAAGGAQALPWLQAGASQPQGFGILSQLTLGNLYAQGQGGIPQNPHLAQHYLVQAKQSLNQLATSRTPQSQMMLGALPRPPQELAAQLDQAIRQLSQSMNAKAR